MPAVRRRGLLRDRRFWWRWLIYFAPWAIAWGLLLLYHYDQRDREALVALESASREQVGRGVAVFSTALDQAQADLRALAGAGELAAFAETRGAEPSRVLVEAWRDFLKIRPVYETLSFVDADGRERLRVESRAGQPAATAPRPADALHAELAGRLPRGEIAVSAPDFTTGGPAAGPAKPEMHLALPVVDRAGKRHGLLTLSYPAGDLLGRLDALSPPGGPPLMLLDTDGSWLHGAPAGAERAVVSGRAATLDSRFPGSWAALQAAASGQRRDLHGVWTWASVDAGHLVGNIAGGPVWKLVARLPAERLAALVEAQRRQRGIAFVAGLVFLLLATWRMAEARQRQKLAERELRELNAGLERQIDQRTRSLQNEIFDRQMAERRYRESSEQYQRLVATTVDAYWLLDDGGGFLDVNQAACELVGASRDALLGMTVSDLDPAPAGDGLKARLAKLGRAGFERFETGLRRRDGRLVEVEISASYLPDYQRFTVFVRDISERKRNERERRLAALVMSNTDEAILVADAAGRVLSVNPAFAKITGMTPSAAAGEPVDSLGLASVDGKESLSRLLTAHRGWRGEMRGRRMNGEVYPVWLSATAVHDDDEQVASYVCVFSDITEIKASQARLDFLAHHDALTGLPNRLLFRARLEHSIERAERAESRIAVLFIDLDHFKEVNDGLGHAVGDQLLIDLAGAMAGCLRAEDTLARLGGDEFVVLLEQVAGRDSVDAVLEKLRQVYPWVMVGPAGRIAVTASIGVALYPEHAADADGLLTKADAAMYRAKDAGRDRACYA